MTVVGPVALLKVALSPKCNHLCSLLQIIDVTKLLLPEVPLQVFGLPLKHSLTQQLLTFRILTASVLINCDSPEPLLSVVVF